MRWDRFTVAPRKLRLLLTAVVAVAVVGGLVGGRVSRPAEVAARFEPAPVAGEAEGLKGVDAVGAGQDLVEGEAQPAPEDPATVVEEAAAWQVAADFAAGYATHRFDDGPSAAADRVRPFVTAELAAQLDGGSGAAAASAERAARREMAVAEVQAVQPQAGSVSAGRLELLVVVRQDVGWDGGSEVYWPTYLVEVSRSPDGWRVSRLLP